MWITLLCLQYRELELDSLALEAQEADETGTVAKEDRLKNVETNGIASSSG